MTLEMEEGKYFLSNSSHVIYGENKSYLLEQFLVNSITLLIYSEKSWGLVSPRDTSPYTRKKFEKVFP